MSIRMDEIKDPRLRARIEDALGAGGGGERPAGCADGKVDTRTVGATDSRPPVRCCSTQPTRHSRIRQSIAPLMNKLETEWFDIIKDKYPNYPPIRPQAKRYRLGNGIWFKVDFSVSIWPNRNPDDTVRGADMETCWEVKGPHAFRGGFENLKVAAGLWSEVRWVLAWKERGQWKTQEVLP